MNSSVSIVQKAIADLQNGKMVVLVDNPDRENEGDLCMATEHLTESHVQFMAEHGRGLICVSIDAEVATKLNLPLQTQVNNSQFGTPFAVSVDHKSVASVGVLPSSRAFTMRKLVEEGALPQDFVSPGHVFPLIANSAGVIGRQGQTEGSYDLARLAGLAPSGVICEILNPDGTMMRGEELTKFSKLHGLTILSVSDIIQYRVNFEVLVRDVADSFMDTDFGRFKVHVFQDDSDQKEHLALVYGDLKRARSKAPLVRIHSECLTGDVFGSLRCDCGQQLSSAAKQIVNDGCGVILYLRQEGRGIGLLNKLKAYALQDQGLDTVEANLELGFSADERDFVVAANMLVSLGVTSARLLTNNPEKIDTIESRGINVTERVALVVEPNEHSREYLATKRTKLGHLL